MKKKFKFLNEMIEKQRFRLVLLVLATIAYVTFTLLEPIVFGFIIDNVVNLDPITNPILLSISNMLGGVDFIRHNLWVGAIIMLLLALLSGLMVFSRSRLNGLISENVAFNVKTKLYHHFMHLPYSFFVKSKTGDLIQRSTSDVDVVRRVFAGQISEFVWAMSMVLISFFIMLSKDVQLALIAVALFPVIFAFAIVFFKKVQVHFRNLEHSESEMTSNISENLAAVRVVKAFNREAYESEMFEEKNSNYRSDGKKLIRSLGIYWGVSDLICFSSILLALTASVIRVLNGTLSIGDAFIFTSYTSMVVWPLRHLGRIIADLGKISVSIDRITEIIDTPLEDLEVGIEPVINGDITLRDVKFKYDDGIHHVLNGINMDIKAGESIAILGPTGAGKSSLVHLLLGLYDYDSGSIKFGDAELKDISKHHLRDNVSIVLQEPFLFSKTIKENIIISKPNANKHQLDYAANIAHVDEFINNFDLGYDTMVGERGTTLSGGQKQRMAIARTVVNEKPILIFDDSLSAVDTETDSNIRAKLKDVKQETTTIIITQRVSSSMDADKIFVIEKGVITQVGNHESLVNEEGLYKRIYDVQSKLDLGEDYEK